MKFKPSSLIIVTALFGTAIMPAQAGNEALMELLKVLRDKGTISAQDYDMLKNAAAADKVLAENEKAEMKKEVEQATAKMPEITTDGKLVVADKGGNWEFQPIGRVMWDALAVDNDGLYDNNPSVGDNEGRGTELRRARLGFKGRIYNLGYKFEGDFAGGGTSVKDAYISYANKLTDSTEWNIKLGQSHVAFGYNTRASSNPMSFIDRPLFADSILSPSRESGVAVQLNDKDYRWLLASAFTSGAINQGETDIDDADTWTVRGSFVPYMRDKTHMLQIGAGYLNRGNGDGTFRYRQRIVSHITSQRPLDTSVANYDGSKAYTFDVLGIYGPFHALAEYLDYTAESKTNADHDFTGYAVEAGYFLTGESYKWSKGYNSGVTPQSKYGAWQVVARFENIETEGLISGRVQTEDEADKYTLGINYIPRKNIRFMLNYDKVTDLTVNGISQDAEPSALKLRAQAFW